MMVCNTLSGAVTEYTRHEFQSLTPTHAGAAFGLFELGGDTDSGLPIVADVTMPATLREGTLKKRIEHAYLSIRGEGCAEFSVLGIDDRWRYDAPILPSGQTRAVVGRGIRENYMGFGLSNPAGQWFTLDRIEVRMRQMTRRL